jgi:GTP-dependent phosphoenolpyruvate carboxykinase
MTTQTLEATKSTNQSLLKWVEEMTALCQPDDVVWCDGSEEEYQRFCAELVKHGTFTKLNQAKRPALISRAPIPAMSLASKTELTFAPKPKLRQVPPITGLILQR